ncbi:thioester dehydrase [Aliikangiella sp. G2MR2-5]|uniref:ApeI family dehydratase n=1 Tax=Aliikangiella sp. G2MR2-5 TaxID=2788943 RepID=UPI0018AAFB3B|nr:thioester dehydrase [Aliikangiella sp. G2MR2-5]
MQLARVDEINEVDDGIELLLEINGDLDSFDGHFDEVAILPGVIQIGWALAYAKIYKIVSEEKLIDSISALKFQQVIVPGDLVNLSLRLHRDTLVFSFTSGDKKHSSGKLLLSE